MNEAKPKLTSPTWQTYVITIQCDFIGDHVSLMVKNDWTSQCTWYKKYKDPVSESKKKIKLDKKTRRQIELCQDPLCSYVIGCRDWLIEEEQETPCRGT